MKKIINTVFAILLALGVYSQNPQPFKYQAIVRDPSGSLITNKIIEIQIGILKGNANGTIVYSESHFPATNQFGIINLEIGNGTQTSGSFANIVWANDSYYINISINGNELGTSQLLSVPYALYADKTANGFSGNYTDLINKPTFVDGNWVTITGKPALEAIALSGSYNNLSDIPAPIDGTWALLANKPEFASVATTANYNELSNIPTAYFSGSYTNLTDKPVLFDGFWNSLTGTPTFSSVSLTGSYNDLLNKPILFGGNYDNLTSKPNLFDGTWTSLSGKPSLSAVAYNNNYNVLKNIPTLFSGNYDDLSNKPILFSGAYASLTNKPLLFDGKWTSLSLKPTFATVATSGSYNDLISKPSIFSGSYNDLTNKPILTSWTWTLITGKPSFSTVATSGSYTSLTNKPILFSGSYNDLLNQPSLPLGTWASITGKPSFANVASTGSYTNLINIPIYFTGSYTDLTNKPTMFNGTYASLSNKPALFSGSWNSLTGVPIATVATSGSYNNLSNKPLPFSGDYNDLSNKQLLFDGTWSSLTLKPTFATVATSGSYNDLSNKPVISSSWSSILNKPTTLAGYSISDAMSTSHVANGITSTLTAHWNTTYGWGNSASAGYANAATAANFYTQTQLNTTGQAQVHFNNITNKPTTLTNYGITDAMRTTHAANGITASKITDWNEAYSWGNHASAGYGFATDYYSKNNLQNSGQAQVLWSNITNKPTSLLSDFGFADIKIVSPLNSQLLHFNSTSGKWENFTPNFLTTETQQLSLSTNELTITNGNTITFSNWDIDKSDDLNSSNDQTITNNKTFTGTITTNNAISANNGLNANNKNITNVAEPVNDQDIATKAYIDNLNLESQLASLQTRYDNIMTHFVTDIEGNMYKTVTVGTQTWMAENLTTTHYQNGDLIPTTTPLGLNVLGDTLINHTAYTWPCHGEEANVPVYGRLYNHYTVVDPRNVCPIGWHVPAKTEWEVLIDFLGGLSVAGGKLKETGTSHWQSPNAEATNSSGMTVLPAGNRMNDGKFAEFLQWGCFQTTTSTPGYPNNSYHFHMFYTAGNASMPDGIQWHFTKVMAFAVRCLKD